MLVSLIDFIKNDNDGYLKLDSEGGEVVILVDLCWMWMEVV